MTNMPVTIANWLTETMRPRIRAGEISAMYIGEAIEATPTPTPPRMRKTTKRPNESASAVPTAETRNRMPERTWVFFRPAKSLTNPATDTPITQPSKALEAAQPFMAAFSLKCSCRKPMAPEITAVS